MSYQKSVSRADSKAMADEAQMHFLDPTASLVTCHAPAGCARSAWVDEGFASRSYREDRKQRHAEGFE